jgi:iron-sulfur cluster repair protein YtfE (RIC family)
MTDMQGAPHAAWAFAEHEHRELMQGIDRIHDVACATDGWLSPDILVRVHDVLRWLADNVEPHISWEESWLYPEIDARTGTPWATRSARFDHRQIRNMAVRVREDEEALVLGASHELLPGLRCHLFGLEALLRAHVEREERYLIPLLTDDEWRAAGPTIRSDLVGAGRAPVSTK